MVVDFRVHLVIVATMKELLKSDCICQSYAQLKRGPSGLCFSTRIVYVAHIYSTVLSIKRTELMSRWTFYGREQI